MANRIKLTYRSEEIVYEEQITRIESVQEPFNQIVLKDRKLDLSISINDESDLKLSSLFQLRVNVKDAGVFHFFLKPENIDKKELIKQVLTLKNVEEEKVKSLLEILIPNNPLFIIVDLLEKPNISYKQLGDLFASINDQTNIFFVEHEVEIIEPVQEEEHVEEQVVEKEEKTEELKEKSSNSLLKLIILNKYHLLLVMISALLFTATISLGLFNIAIKNKLYFFLFVCSLIGIAMNGYCYLDYFKRKSIKDNLFYCSVASNVIGLLIGCGTYAILYNLTKKGTNPPGMGKYLLLGLLFSFLISAVLIVAIYFINKKKNKG